MKRFLPIISFILLLVWFVVPASLALAAYNYSVPIRVYNNSTTGYPNGLPILVSLNNSQLSSFGYISANGLDTDVQEGATSRDFMAASGYLGIFFPSVAESQVRTTNYRLGNTPAQTGFPVIVGWDGNVTVDDAAALELGNNFSVVQNVWVDTSAGIGKNLINKNAAFRTWVSGATNITSIIVDAAASDLISQAVDDGHLAVDANDDFVGQAFTTPAGGISLVHITTRWFKNVAPTGTLTVAIRATSGGLPVGGDLVSATKNIATIAAGAPGVAYDFALAYDLEGGTVYAVVAYSTDIAGNYIGVRENTAGGYAGGSLVSALDGAAWSKTVGRDLYFEVNGKGAAVLVTATGVSSGERQVDTIATPGGNLLLYIDGGLEDSTAMGGKSVPSNANDWAFIDGDYTVSYMNSLTITINATQRLWFEPNTMVTGSILTDRQGGDNNGTINWGSNPAGVEVTVGSMGSSASTTATVVTNQTAPDLLSAPPSIEYFPTVTEPELVNMPMYDSVAAQATSIGMSTANAYLLWMWITCMVMGFAGLVALGSGWGFIGGYTFGATLALGTPVPFQFLLIVPVLIGVLGMFVWRRVA